VYLQAGRIEFELFNDITPRTVENFLRLSAGDFGDSNVSGKPLKYKGSKFHRIIKYEMSQFMHFNLHFNECGISSRLTPSRQRVHVAGR
jgi:cyclophilin family peptidyl-prolyl cis-trans isomerase